MSLVRIESGAVVIEDDADFRPAMTKGHPGPLSRCNLWTGNASRAVTGLDLFSTESAVVKFYLLATRQLNCIGKIST